MTQILLSPSSFSSSLTTIIRKKRPVLDLARQLLYTFAWMWCLYLFFFMSLNVPLYFMVSEICDWFSILTSETSTPECLHEKWNCYPQHQHHNKLIADFLFLFTGASLCSDHSSLSKLGLIGSLSLSFSFLLVICTTGCLLFAGSSWR